MSENRVLSCSRSRMKPTPVEALCRGRGSASGESLGSDADTTLHNFRLRERQFRKNFSHLPKRRPIFKNPYYKKNLYLNIIAIIPEERCSIIKNIVR